MPIFHVQRSIFAILLVTSFLAGCGGSADEVSGTVTFKGRPLPEGYITFFPHDDDGNAAGATVVAGRYSVTGLVPGKRRVLITATPPVRVVKERKRGEAKAYLIPYQRIPTNATGNNKVVEVVNGKQVINFDL